MSRWTVMARMDLCKNAPFAARAHPDVVKFRYAL
jgi:hypothetical protein